ncbi:MAG: SDR family NAD(P)-dependent oxidoreductase [Proteobacteria bacterium]|nr:SDR family NAD(P)-dependent oxidoreductase [Pseudomonadota bacterium]
MIIPLPTGLTPQVTLISGYRGLAESLIEAFQNKNNHVSVLVKNKTAVNDLKKKYPEALFISGNVQSQGDCIFWIKETLKRFGKIDHLINNAAIIGPCGKLHELNFKELEETIQINFTAPLFLIQQILPHFLKQNSGVVINLSGGGATAPRPHFGAYGATKCALVRFTESLALEYPQFLFYSVAPGALKTPMMEGISKLSVAKIGKEQEEAANRIQHGGDDPNKAAELIRWLCETKPISLNGKLISAKWDDYRNPPQHVETIPFWTLRRVDSTLLKNLKTPQENS